MSQRILLLTILLIGFSSCSPMKSSKIKHNKDFKPEVIYGQDNRLDFYRILDPRWMQIAEASVAIIDKDLLTLDSSNQVYDLQTEVYGKDSRLCLNEAFYQQPTAAFCSGFLIGPQIVITAGHCIRNDYNCSDARFVFDFHYRKEIKDLSKVESKNVYSCRDVIHTENDFESGSDYAIIRLDRDVTDRTPMSIRQSGLVSADDELTVIGYPSGLPGKLADRGVIRENSNENYFTTTLDTYGGNSGSAVINSRSLTVEGILVRGETDFIYDTQSKCYRSNVCQEDGCRGEDVVRIKNVLKHLSPADL